MVAWRELADPDEVWKWDRTGCGTIALTVSVLRLGPGPSTQYVLSKYAARDQ